MARHFYNIEVVTDELLSEDELADMEDAVRKSQADVIVHRADAEYVDSEDK